MHLQKRTKADFCVTAAVALTHALGGHHAWDLGVGGRCRTDGVEGLGPGSRWAHRIGHVLEVWSKRKHSNLFTGRTYEEGHQRERLSHINVPVKAFYTSHPITNHRTTKLTVTYAEDAPPEWPNGGWGEAGPADWQSSMQHGSEPGKIPNVT